MKGKKMRKISTIFLGRALATRKKKNRSTVRRALNETILPLAEAVSVIWLFSQTRNPSGSLPSQQAVLVEAFFSVVKGPIIYPIRQIYLKHHFWLFTCHPPECGPDWITDCLISARPNLLYTVHWQVRSLCNCCCCISYSIHRLWTMLAEREQIKS